MLTIRVMKTWMRATRSSTNLESTTVDVPVALLAGSEGMSMPAYRFTSTPRSQRKSEYRRRTMKLSGWVRTRYVT